MRVLRGWPESRARITTASSAAFATSRSRQRLLMRATSGRRRCAFLDWVEQVAAAGIHWVDQSPGKRPDRGRSGGRMSDWQKIIKDESIATLDKLAEKFGRDAIDVEALRPAFENFQMR